jgi:hypothetical protein
MERGIIAFNCFSNDDLLPTQTLPQAYYAHEPCGSAGYDTPITAQWRGRRYTGYCQDDIGQMGQLL